MAFDLQSARFSTNFLEDTPLPEDSSDKRPRTSTTTNPFRSQTPPPEESESPELDPTFDFASNLETHDSVSSLDQIGSPDNDRGSSPSNNEASPTTTPPPPNDQSTVTETIVTAEIEPQEKEEERVVVVARTSDHWEKFDENGLATPTTPPNGEVVEESVKKDEQEQQNGTANGAAKSGEQDKTGNWEKFEETKSKAVTKKLLSVTSDEGAGGASVCAADAMVSDSQWTALEDSSNQFGEYDDSNDQPNLPFRAVQSMRVNTNRKVQIVDALRQRRLSNSSLDREPSSRNVAQFKNEDELTRTFKVEREWQVYVKMDKRIPGTKTNWLPVNISIKDGVLVLKRSAPPSMPISSSTVVPLDAPPLHEIRLFHNHTLTKPVLRVFERKKKSKVHQIKLRQTQVHERRTLRRWLFVEHVSTARTIVKLGCPDLNLVQSLSDQINEAIRQLPVTRQQGVAYRMNEVFVDVKDNSSILMNCDGAVLERRSLNRIYIQAFLSGSGECRVILNDIEALLLQGKGQMTTSMSRQVRLNDVVLHPCVDKSTYKTSRELKFRPVDGYPFELLRCSIDPYISPPVNVNALMEYNEQRNTVKITASFSIRKKHNLRLRPIKDLIVKFPIPSSWSSLFLAESRFGGKKSVRSTAALRGSFRRKVKSSACSIETPLGSAKYEPEHGSILWRIGHYVESRQPHTFSCDVQLQAGMHKPDINKEHCEVTYTLPGNSTGLQIRAFKVDKSTPERWVKYEIQYHYSVQMFPDLSID